MKAKGILKDMDLARLIIAAFFVLLCVAAIALKLNAAELITSSLTRMGMWGVLVLAMLPAILAGTGPNFGVSLGIVCGLLGGLLALELAYRLEGAVYFSPWALFLTAMIFSLPFALLMGVGYGWILNRVKGSEMMIATYVGFSIVSIMKLAWVFLPFKSPEMAWPIGRGVRVQIALENRGLAQLLNNFLAFRIGAVTIPTGLLLTVALALFLMWLFLRSRTGMALAAAGSNPRFAEACGINVDRQRIVGTVLSTVLGAWGILIYSQSYGFLQLYEGPMFMPFVAVAAILIGGASVKKATIAHVVIGTVLFLGIQVVAVPVANAFTAEWSSMGEISRKIIQNGVILYALTQAGGE